MRTHGMRNSNPVFVRTRKMTEVLQSRQCPSGHNFCDIMLNCDLFAVAKFIVITGTHIPTIS